MSHWLPCPPTLGRVRLCICGSRGYPHLDFVRYYVWTMRPFVSLIIHGGARGVDVTVGEACERYGIPVLVFLPDWDKHGRAAGPRRNTQMVYESDAVVAFWDGKSKGTMNTIGTARTQGKLRAAYGVGVVDRRIERLW